MTVRPGWSCGFAAPRFDLFGSRILGAGITVDQIALLRSALAQAPGRVRMLRVVAGLGLPDSWIAAGAVRNAVWDLLDGYACSTPLNDVDVIWFDPDRADPEVDRHLEARLALSSPGFIWSVKNQARMHARNGDAPYAGCAEAMESWPETATAIAVGLCPRTGLQLLAPFGLDDLLSLRLRPTPRFAQRHPGDFRRRIAAKRWLLTWPGLTIQDEP